MDRGRFVVFEGIDGAGTTTQTRMLLERVEAEFPRLPVAVTAEPTERPVGRMIRDVLGGRLSPFDRRALALLFAADRLDHLEGEIQPLLSRGTLLICDRYVLSSLAYQGMDAPREWVEVINRFAPRPDLTIFLDCLPEVAFARIEQRRHSMEIFETRETIHRVAEAYRESIALVGTRNLVELDSNLPVGEVADLVWDAVKPVIS